MEENKKPLEGKKVTPAKEVEKMRKEGKVAPGKEKRTFSIERDSRTSNWVFKSDKGGPIPKELSGQFTSIRLAEYKLELYNLNHG